MKTLSNVISNVLYAVSLLILIGSIFFAVVSSEIDIVIKVAAVLGGLFWTCIGIGVALVIDKVYDK